MFALLVFLLLQPDPDFSARLGTLLPNHDSPVLLVYSSDTCGYCIRFKADVRSGKWDDLLADIQLFVVDDNGPHASWFQSFYGETATPTFHLYDASLEKELATWQGYHADTFANYVHQGLRGRTRIAHLLEAYYRDPNYDHALALAVAYSEYADYEHSQAWYREAIRFAQTEDERYQAVWQAHFVDYYRVWEGEVLPKEYVGKTLTLMSALPVNYHLSGISGAVYITHYQLDPSVTDQDLAPLWQFLPESNIFDVNQQGNLHYKYFRFQAVYSWTVLQDAESAVAAYEIYLRNYLDKKGLSDAFAEEMLQWMDRFAFPGRYREPYLSELADCYGETSPLVIVNRILAWLAGGEFERAEHFFQSHRAALDWEDVLYMRLCFQKVKGAYDRQLVSEISAKVTWTDLLRETAWFCVEMGRLEDAIMVAERFRDCPGYEAHGNILLTGIRTLDAQRQRPISKTLLSGQQL